MCSWVFNENMKALIAAWYQQNTHTVAVTVVDSRVDVKHNHVVHTRHEWASVPWVALGPKRQSCGECRVNSGATAM